MPAKHSWLFTGEQKGKEVKFIKKKSLHMRNQALSVLLVGMPTGTVISEGNLAICNKLLFENCHIC